MLERPLADHLSGRVGHARLVLLRTPIDTDEPLQLQPAPPCLPWTDRARQRCLPGPVLALCGADSPLGIHRWLDRRGTSPGLGAPRRKSLPGSSRRPARPRRNYPRKVIQNGTGRSRPQFSWRKAIPGVAPAEVAAVAILAPDILATEHGADWRLVAVGLEARRLVEPRDRRLELPPMRAKRDPQSRRRSPQQCSNVRPLPAQFRPVPAGLSSS